jgi:hypothetical protein
MNPNKLAKESNLNRPLTPEESNSHIGIAMIKDPTERIERQWAHDNAIEESRRLREEATKLSQAQA